MTLQQLSDGVEIWGNEIRSCRGAFLAEHPCGGDSLIARASHAAFDFAWSREVKAGCMPCPSRYLSDEPGAA